MKYVFTFFLFALVSETGFTQNLLIGPKAGFQLSGAYSDNPHFYDNFYSRLLPTFQVGLVANVEVSDIFSLQTEVLYNQTGKRMVGHNDYSFQNERYHNITLPALLRASYTAGMNKFYANIGPSLSYWLGGSGKIKFAELQEESIVTRDYRIRFGENKFQAQSFYVTKPNRLLFSLEAGIGAMLPMRQNFLMLDLRYSWGHTNLAQDDTSYMFYLESDGQIIHATQTISLSVAYLFELDFLEMTKGKTSGKKKK